MFVRKLVEKASKKHHIGGITGLRAEDVSPRLAFHYGVPADAALLAYDPALHVLAIATRNGQIKLFGRDNTQALLQSPSPVPCKFLRFAEGQGVLLNVNIWDIDTKKLWYVHPFEKEITAFSVLQNCLYIYVGDSFGNVSLLKLDLGQTCLVDMPYWIPFSESYGSGANVGNEVEVAFVLPQPLAENNRVLIIFRDGIMSLWDIHTSKVVSLSGKSMQQQSHQEAKTVTSACWACAKGSKIAIGFYSGDIYLWSIPDILNAQNLSSMSNQNLPLQRLNLGYKLDRVSIVSLRWVHSGGKAGRLYVNGFSDHAYLFQVLILNEESESRIVKMVLPLTEACQGMELVSGLSDPNKHKQSALVLLLKSGQICLYDDSEIERYLLHAQSRSPQALPNYSSVKLPYGDSSITAAKFYTSSPTADYFSSLATKYPWFLSMKDKHQTSTGSADIHKTRNLYVTGHLDGTIRFWDASCPLLLQNLMIKQQNEDNSPSGTPITSLQFDMSSSILICGNRSGMVRIITFKKDSSDNRFSFLHAKQGESYNVRCIKLKGAVTSISLISNSKRVAVGTEKGIVSVVSIEDASILYQKQLDCRVSGGIASLQFEMYSHNGYDKNLLIVGMEDSTIFILEEESGKLLNTNPVQTNKPCRALLMQTLELSPDDPSVSDTHDTVSKESLLLLCTENAIRLFSLSHAIQGMKNIINKKKPNGSCCFASLIHSVSSEIGLLLVFSNGKIEIRSLPDLSILKEASLRGFAYTRNLNSSSSIACSSDGEIILVNGEETFFFSTLCQNDIYRHVDSINTIYRKDNSPREESSYVVKSPREKKKGIFGMIMKDTKASKGKQSDANGDEQFTATTSEELSSIFSCANFAPVSEKRNSSIKDDENIELDIDDINIDDNPQKQKGPHFPGLSKQKISKGFQSLREKLKPRTEERVNSGNRKPEDDTSISQVDQIKMKYGYATNDDSTSIPKMIGNKLQENIKKLEGINIRAGDMANGAQSFSAMAKELLQNTKNEKATSMLRGT
uniref:Lethal giant larvae (Lgl)-like C-terminal domain-containing protein n=2 Tax=Oryza punctata TaxID=4537 RepID=A0A0E0KU00_ORYPU